MNLLIEKTIRKCPNSILQIQNELSNIKNIVDVNVIASGLFCFVDTKKN